MEYILPSERREEIHTLDGDVFLLSLTSKFGSGKIHIVIYGVLVFIPVCLGRGGGSLCVRLCIFVCMCVHIYFCRLWVCTCMFKMCHY